ncbi:hypothetical protein SAMN05192529_1463 [Arachidicoccus rhizosphaerae]|uniref:Uncharacterized protein n=1 Tax=Arachidicoccus rhizosphaerae TaxID=551991 RepID=A0A1H4D6D7_9BACT|nr:hypothetical protein SAMN05192529_1463 [Arachidicoccus rhizosphaerae]
MASDANKNISGIVYNYLNLPERITVTGNPRLENMFPILVIQNSMKKASFSILMERNGLLMTPCFLKSH